MLSISLRCSKRKKTCRKWLLGSTTSNGKSLHSMAATGCGKGDVVESYRRVRIHTPCMVSCTCMGYMQGDAGGGQLAKQSVSNVFEGVLRVVAIERSLCGKLPLDLIHRFASKIHLLLGFGVDVASFHSALVPYGRMALATWSFQVDDSLRRLEGLILRARRLLLRRREWYLHTLWYHSALLYYFHALSNELL